MKHMFPMPDELDWNEDIFEDRKAVSAEFLSMMFDDLKNKEKGKVVPDTLGADKLFIEFFVTSDMQWDFWQIAKDFLKHHFPRVKEFNDMVWYGNDRPGHSSPEESLQRKILNVIRNASKTGDPYAVELLKYLYKTYYKKEYRQLKRFKEINVSEIFSLSEDEDGHSDFCNMARILVMCELFGIKLDEGCSVLYLMLDRKSREWEAEDTYEPFAFEEGVYQECLIQVESWMQFEQQNGKKQKYPDSVKFWELDEFVDTCCKYHGYSGDYLYRSNCEYRGNRVLFAKTLALLKSTFPKKEFTYEEVQTYAHIYNGIETIVNVSEDYNSYISEMLGVMDEEELFEGEKRYFQPEKIIYRETEMSKQVKKAVNIAPVIIEKAEQADYLQEIDELRQRLSKKEQECRYFKEQSDHAKTVIKEQQEMLAKCENDREELIALRDYVYNLSEEAPELEEKCLEEMTAAIAKKNIVIIGGHVNWINKLKKQFPKWKYFTANLSRTNEAQLLTCAEKVYFYTDHISHGTYGKLISMVREQKIPFGYLHTIYMGALVKQIYDEVVG